VILSLVAAAVAAPDRLASTYVVGTSVTDVVVSAEGGWAGWNDQGTGDFTVLDTGTFIPTVIAASCPSATGAAVSGDTTVGWTFYTGCDDGTVAVIEVSPAGDISLSGTPLTLGDGPVLAVETDGENVYAVVDDPTEGAMVAAVTVDGDELSGFPTALQSDTVEDTVLVGTTLIVAHGGDEVSKVLTTDGTALLPQSSLGRQLVDAYPYTDGLDVYLADEGGGLVRFEITENDYVASLTNVADVISAVGIEPVEGWMILGAGGADALLYGFDSGLPGTEQSAIDGATNLTDIVTFEGYALGATSDGTVLVLTDHPWVTVDSVSPASVTDGDEVTLTFSTDTAGYYEIRRGGTAVADGTVLDDGDVAADTPTSVSFTVSSAGGYEEGANTLWVFLKDANGLVGRAAGSILVDNPPGKVGFDESGVGLGNESFSVAFTALEAEDIESYTIYVDVAPFTAADHPTGGPEFSGTDDITAPLSFAADPGSSVSRTFSPVTNGTTYYVAVRATDEGGLEGPMSEIQSVTPEETFSVSARAGEKGGYLPPLCGTGSGAGAAVVALAAALVTRRRRVAGGAALLAIGLAVTPAHAATDDDESPRTMNVQLRYGPITVADPYITDVFGGNATGILWFEYGYASRFVDANLGVGFFQEKGFLQTAAGEASSEDDTFTMVPLALTLTGRLDLFDEQPIVPFGRLGVDYWMWEENWYVASPETTDHIANGGKYGWHFGGGLMFLLDAVDRRAASRLEAVSGINDTFLVAEYRNTLLVHGEDQLNLSSSEVSFGLKFDF
jgi:hypothetical protein